MAKQPCGFSQAEVLKQMVLNTSTSLELFREAVSNSVDADCKSIHIVLNNCGGQLWDIIIQDDGHGMGEAHMSAYFSMGKSVKDYPSKGVGEQFKATQSIGEKGLGSKTTFVARDIRIESWRRDSDQRLVATLERPMEALLKGEVPSFEVRAPEARETLGLESPGTRIELRGVRIPSFNGKQCSSAEEVADRLLHYLRCQCATGTVKNRFAHKRHIKDLVFNVGSIPDLTVEVNCDGQSPARRGPVPGVYSVPEVNVNPVNGLLDEGTGVEKKSENFCDLHEFGGSKTLTIRGTNTTVHYDGIAIIAGYNVRAKMLEHEMKQGWTHKSQMGVHLCRDFIPMKVDGTITRDLLANEYFYDFKVFLNCQWFSLNADRNTVTNLDSEEVQWVLEDFKAKVWPQLEGRWSDYHEMSDREKSAIESIRKAQQASRLKAGYSEIEPLTQQSDSATIKFAKAPRTEADVSHLLAMLVQSGAYRDQLRPIAKFGSYIDRSTDLLCEDEEGRPLLVEVERSLPSLFNHGHPVASYDAVVVWDLGGMTAKDEPKRAPWGDNGSDALVRLDGSPAQGWRLAWGMKTKRLIVLSEFV